MTMKFFQAMIWGGARRAVFVLPLRKLVVRGHQPEGLALLDLPPG